MMISGKANELPDLQVFNTVFYYCIVIIALPVVTFFGTKVLIFDGLLRLESIPSNVYSAVSAIVVLHVALAMYIVRAYSDADHKPKPPSKAD